MKIENNKATLQPIEIGLQNETSTQVVKGLNQGEQIIDYPSDQISAGTSVRIVSGNACQ